jgi:hypothetical protein
MMVCTKKFGAPGQERSERRRGKKQLGNEHELGGAMSALASEASQSESLLDWRATLSFGGSTVKSGAHRFGRPPDRQIFSNQGCFVPERLIQTDGRTVFNKGYTR